jgi:hypothetical protein
MFSKYRSWGSHSGTYEELCLQGYNVIYSGESQLTFRRNMSPPSSGSEKQESNMSLPASCCSLAWLLLYPEDGDTCYSETSVDFHWIICCYITEGGTLEEMPWSAERLLASAPLSEWVWIKTSRVLTSCREWVHVGNQGILCRNLPSVTCHIMGQPPMMDKSREPLLN